MKHKSSMPVITMILLVGAISSVFYLYQTTTAEPKLSEQARALKAKEMSVFGPVVSTDVDTVLSDLHSIPYGILKSIDMLKSEGTQLVVSTGSTDGVKVVYETDTPKDLVSYLFSMNIWIESVNYNENSSLLEVVIRFRGIL